MHVLQLGPFPPPEGGVSRNMLAIRDELAAGGHTCSVIATTRSSEARDEPDVYRPRSPFAVISLLRKLQYDVLHLHVGGEINARVFALMLACTVFGRGGKVLTVHSGAYPQTDHAKSAKRSSIRGMILRRFDRVIAVNEALADVFRRYGVVADRVKVILPYALKRPDSSVAVPDKLRQFYKAHSPILLAVGGLEKDYDPLFQIEALKGVLAGHPNAGLMIVGDGSMRAEVEAAAAASGYAENICIAGNVEHAVTLHLINGADVLLRTTLFDGDAISVREALFLGTPVVATDNGMRPDGVRLIAVGDRVALQDAITAAVRARSPESSKTAPENENINAVIRIYEDLA